MKESLFIDIIWAEIIGNPTANPQEKENYCGDENR